MPPVRTMPAIKPTKTERSHEENQERAYIAASRRSDRSLEARVESARRASEIHEKRTGRRLRVTEQDVINEEMYEEEDDNIPWRYRHLALLPNLSTLSPEFRRRVEAQLVLEMERSRMVDPNGMFHQPQFMNPGMMQMPHAGQMYPPSMFQFGQNANMMSPQTPLFPQQSPLLSAQQPSARVAQRHSPYPLPGTQRENSSRPSVHHRSASIANPQELSAYQQQHSQAAQTPPAGTADNRRMSLPPQTSSNTHSPNIQPKTDPAARSTTSDASSSQNTPKLPVQGHPQFPQSYPFSYADTNSFAPLTSTLPINTQQILGGEGMFPFMDDMDLFKPNGMSNAGMAQPMYSYNPNPVSTKPSKKRTHDQFSATSTSGLDQTLTMPTTLDTANVHSPSNDGGFLNQPLSASSNAVTSASTEHPGLAFHGDNACELDAFGSSGAGSPADFNSFVNDDFFGDQQYAF